MYLLYYWTQSMPNSVIQWLLVEALGFLHWVMRAVTYRHIAMAIKMASIVGVFVDCCLFACFPGGFRGNME